MYTINKWRRGLTLVELIVSLAIIAVLAGAVIVVNVPVTLQKARDGERKTELEAIRQALELYRYDNGGYPSGNNNVQTLLQSVLETAYIPDVPDDPSSTSKGYYYRYQGTSCTGSVCSSYNLCAMMELAGVAGSCGTIDCDDSPATDCNYKTTNP